MKSSRLGGRSADWNHKVCRLEGIPIGISSGGIIAAAVRVAQRAENDGKMIVVVVPSSSERYLSTWIYANIDAKSDEVPSAAS
jgi:cysteine synthase